MKSKKALAASLSLGTVVTTAAVLGFSAPALASSARCEARPYVVLWHRTCRTGPLASNAHHDLRIIVQSNIIKCTVSPWEVWDVNTGKVVASGRQVPRNVVVHGLYGVYEGRLDDACYKDLLILQDY